MAQIFGYPEWLRLPLLGVAGGFFVLCLIFGMRNRTLRTSLNAVLGVNGPSVPEDLIGWYGVAELVDFARGARLATIGGNKALDVYRRPILLWNDTWFAVGLSGALIFLNFAIAPLMPLGIAGSVLAVFCALMSLLYGLADIFEDLKLAQIFGSGRDVTKGDARLASIFTQTKFAALYMACPAIVGLGVKWAYDASPPIFFGVLKLLPLLAIVAAALSSSFARVLWACRVSVASAFAGYALFLFVIQAQDLFADTTYGSIWYLHVGYWTAMFAALAIVWALPVHFAARAAIEGRSAAPYIPPATPEFLIKWTPRVLGLLPVVAVLLGIFGAAIETRNATHLDLGLGPQYVLLALAGWVTLGVVLIFVVERKRVVKKFFGGVESARARKIQKLCAVVTAAVFVVLVCAPLWSTHYVARAALVPFLLGSGVLLFGVLGRLSDCTGKPIIGFVAVAVTVLTAANYSFHDVRRLPADASNTASQMALPQAIAAWRDANRCPVSDDPAKDERQRAECPPVLIIAADGGASRAAYFTATVVGGLLDQLRASPGSKCGDADNPSRCIFAMSGVSGGSLGLAAIKGALLDGQKTPPCEKETTWTACLQQLVGGDYLSPTFIGVGFRDHFAPPVYPFNSEAIWGDRAALLERSWERNFQERTRSSSGIAACPESGDRKGLCRPLAQRSDGKVWTPLLLLNGTSVETGRRVIASELAPVWSKGDGPGPSQPQVLHQWAYDLFEMLGAKCADREVANAACAAADRPETLGATNIRLSTAALVSARFPIISPAGAIHMDGRSDAHGDSVVDGGYFENSGLTSALDIAAAVHSVGLYPIILSISNDPTPTTPSSNQTRIERDCKLAPQPADLTSLRLQVGKPASESIWVRAVETAYAPFMALYKTRDSHAEEAGQVMSQYLQAWDVPKATVDNPCLADDFAVFFPIKVYERGRNFSMPQLSMSWWLSPVVRRALEQQLAIQDNHRQLELLYRRLSKSGCPNCDGQSDQTTR